MSVPVKMTVTLMQSVQILLDLTHAVVNLGTQAMVKTA